MAREAYTLAWTNVDWIDDSGEPRQPRLTIHAAGTAADLERRLTTPADTLPAANEIDVTFRYRPAGEAAAPRGVLGISHNLTGAYILEYPTDAPAIEQFVRAVRRYADTTDRRPSYTLCFQTQRAVRWTYEKQVLLVYGADGLLHRRQSLIPNGVEV